MKHRNSHRTSQSCEWKMEKDGPTDVRGCWEKRRIRESIKRGLMDRNIGKIPEVFMFRNREKTNRTVDRQMNLSLWCYKMNTFRRRVEMEDRCVMLRENTLPEEGTSVMHLCMQHETKPERPAMSSGQKSYVIWLPEQNKAFKLFHERNLY